MTICCCCKVKGNGEKKKAAWRLTLVTASVLAPARQRWRTTSRLPLLAARCRGVLPYWIKERSIWKRSFQSTPDDMWQYWTWWILTSKFFEILFYFLVLKSTADHVKKTLQKLEVMQMLLRTILNVKFYNKWILQDDKVEYTLRAGYNPKWTRKPKLRTWSCKYGQYNLGLYPALNMPDTCWFVQMHIFAEHVMSKLWSRW